MAGRKLSAKTEEEVVFMEHLLAQTDHLKKLVEEYAAAKKGTEALVQVITRTLSQIRQRAMIKNLGPLADQAGMLGIAAGRGSQFQRARILRDGIVSFKQVIERTMKAAIDADARQRSEDEKARVDAKAAAAPKVPIDAAAQQRAAAAKTRVDAKAAAAPWETPPKPES